MGCVGLSVLTGVGIFAPANTTTGKGILAFFTVALPLLSPVLGAGALLGVAVSWPTLEWALRLLSDRTRH